MRSQNHHNLIKGLTTHFKELVKAANFAENKQLQESGE